MLEVRTAGRCADRSAEVSECRWRVRKRQSKKWIRYHLELRAGYTDGRPSWRLVAKFGREAAAKAERDRQIRLDMLC